MHQRRQNDAKEVSSIAQSYS